MTGIETLDYALAGLIVGLTPGVVAMVQAKANANQITRQGDKIEKLANGEGDAKIDSRLRDHALIPPITATTTGTTQNGSE